MTAGVLVVVAQEAFKIGDSGLCRLAEFAQKIGCMADQPPFRIAQHFRRHGQGGGRIAGDPPFRLCRQQPEPTNQVVVPTVEAQAVVEGRDRSSGQRAKMTEELDGNEAVADHHRRQIRR